MRIGTREIGPNQPAYVIAELGVNHDGSVERALELTDAAARAGVDAVKLQLFEAERLMSRASKLAAYQKTAGEKDPVAMLRRLELPLAGMEQVIERAHEKGLHAIVTVFSLEHVEAAKKMAWDAFKTASPDIVNRPLLEALAGMRGAKETRPLIVSTGASTLQEVARALTWLRPVGERLGVLQCVSSYPTPLGQGELGGISAIADIWPGVVGYSDHTPDVMTSAVAVALGAQVLEKHMTYSKLAVGPDHIASLDAREMGEYVEFAIQAFAAKEHLKKEHPPEDLTRFIGGAEKLTARQGEYVKTKRVLPIEEDVRRVSRQSVVCTRAVGAGEVLRREDVTVKRPGTGLPAYLLDDVVGKKALRPIEADVPLVAEDLEGIAALVGGGER
ncbi:MAG TPA: N-acetylneuraminate synthase family protein [Phycisphaerales bacterium]|nr:N-acetylneuraminate synthase family protein [Phycisphaerales bacterium]